MKYKLIMAASLVVLMGACRNASPSSDGQDEQQPKAKAEKKKNIIRRNINIPQDFTYLTNLGSIDVIYTQGNYNVEVEGDSTTLNYVKADFDSNLLTVSIQNDGNQDYNFYGNTSNVKMYVSCPDLQCVSVCGNGGFTSQATWRTENLQLGVLGKGSMNIGKVECTTFSLQSTDVGDINITDLHAEDAAIYSRSSAHINLNVNVDVLTILNDGSQTMKLTGKANKTLIKNPNDKNLVNELKSESKGS
ncbi:MAG: DUF2807 domain-containing protein [Bacteroidaceae bacterium]|nr:DUF2807 domain-containing protein [Bacteroidaceae bacterium]